MKRAGLTLVELLLALGLFSLLVLAVVRLLGTSMNVLGEGEIRRDHMGVEWATSQWLVQDLERIVGGADGDFLVDWWTFDHDGDGIAARPWPRVRLVRRAAAKEHLRLGLRETATDAVDAELGSGTSRDPSAYVEVVWLALPPPIERGAARRGDAVLWRGERLVGPNRAESIFANGFLDGAGMPPAAAVAEVAGGLLWFDVRLADEASLLDREWRVGTSAGDVATAWDARGRGRPDVDRHAANRTLAPPPDDGSARLPRRIRVELEFERPQDRARRTALSAEADGAATTFLVRDPARLPAAGGFLLVGEEWVEHLSTRGNAIEVRRAQRGTRAIVHAPGTLLQAGRSFVREVSPVMHREDWRR